MKLGQGKVFYEEDFNDHIGNSHGLRYLYRLCKAGRALRGADADHVCDANAYGDAGSDGYDPDGRITYNWIAGEHDI